MKIELKGENWDLFTIFIITFIFTIVVILFPDWALLRIILGIPFLLFFPGYVLTLLIFPRKYETEPEKEEKTETPPMGRRRFNVKKKEEPEAPVEKTDRNIDTPVRFALSVALSLGTVAVIGFFLNELYLVNETIFGLEVNKILISIYGFTMIIGILALIRRQKVPKKDRFVVNFKIGPFSDGTPVDKIITSALVISILISAGIGLYLYKNSKENESYTEFYLLGPGKEISEYPEVFVAGVPQSMYIGISNHEFSSEDYTLNIYLDSKIGSVMNISNFDDLEMESNVTFETSIRIDHSEDFLSPCNFSIAVPGLYYMNLDLIKGGEIYRSLQLRTQVFNESDVLFHNNGSLVFYVTGPDGDPTSIPTRIQRDQTLDVLVGLKNLNQTAVHVRFFIHIADPPNWMTVNETPLNVNVTNTTGIFYAHRIMANNQAILPAELLIQRGNWILNFSISQPYENTTIRKSIEVY